MNSQEAPPFNRTPSLGPARRAPLWTPVILGLGLGWDFFFLLVGMAGTVTGSPEVRARGVKSMCKSQRAAIAAILRNSRMLHAQSLPHPYNTPAKTRPPPTHLESSLLLHCAGTQESPWCRKWVQTHLPGPWGRRHAPRGLASACWPIVINVHPCTMQGGFGGRGTPS